MNGSPMRGVFMVVGFVVGLRTAAPRRSERGLSQSTENAILLAGAIVVAGIVIAMVTTYVTRKMPTP